MTRMTASIDARDVSSYDGWGLAEILYSFLVDDQEVYDENPEWRRMQLKKAILKSSEFKTILEGGRLSGGYARPHNPYGTNLGANDV